MLDCHCHLLDAAITPGDDFFAHLKRGTIGKLYCNTIDPGQWPALLELAKKYQQVTPFFGIHPWHITEASRHELPHLARLLENGFFSCGEIGLDRLCKTDFARQEEMFRGQLDIAAQTASFVSIHCVRAWGLLLDILAEYQGRLPFMIHAFQGSREIMERVVGMGGMISFSDRVMQASQKKQQEVLVLVPAAHLLLETDFSFQKTSRGEIATTWCQGLTSLYAFVAGLRKISVAELEQQIDRNGSLCTY